MSAIGAYTRALRAGFASQPAALWVLLLLLVSTMLLGGGSRDDIRSLLVLRPLTALAFVAALALAFPEAWRRGRAIVLLAGLGLVSVLAQLIPLPPGVWASLGGREPVVAAYAAAGLALPWLPVTLTPAATWNAAFALLTPLCGILLGLSLDAHGRMVVLRLVIGIGLVSGFIGLLQAISGPDSALYFYRHTNEGSAVGLFANRNHQAMLLAILFPLLAAHAALVAAARGRMAAFIWPMTYVLWGFLVPLLLVTGSRAGLLAGVVGLGAALWIARSAQRDTRRRNAATDRSKWLIAALGTVLVGGIIAITMTRATAVQRLVAGDEEELRLEVLPVIWRAAGDFFPWGSGYGSFPEVYRIYEPAAMLGPNYLNHAHNDFAELLLTGGMPVLVLLLAGAVLLGAGLWQTVRLRSRDGDRVMIARAMAAATVILVLGSVTDYPLRTPSLALVAATFIAIWVRVLRARRQAAGQASGVPAADLPDNPSPAFGIG